MGKFTRKDGVNIFTLTNKNKLSMSLFHSHGSALLASHGIHAMLSGGSHIKLVDSAFRISARKEESNSLFKNAKWFKVFYFCNFSQRDVI
jgi:hypothetical protein